jgi:hypothetical protein
MTTYIWAWSDRDGVSINESESLETIIKIIFDTFQYDHKLVSLCHCDSSFRITVDTEEVITVHQIDENPDDVSNFLREIASVDSEWDHKFCIIERQKICRI